MNKNCRFKALAAVLSIGALFTAFPTYAQKGEKTLGIAAGYESYNNSGAANIFFQYSFSRHVRLAPELGYIFRNEGKSAFECSVDVHFPFRVARGFKLYPLTGITVNNWDFSPGKRSTHAGFDFGAGLDLYMTSSLKLNLQGKYAVMNNTSGAIIQMGIGYVF